MDSSSSRRRLAGQACMRLYKVVPNPRAFRYLRVHRFPASLNLQYLARRTVCSFNAVICVVRQSADPAIWSMTAFTRNETLSVFTRQRNRTFRIHYNFAKPHQALEGQTPSHRAGLQRADWNELLEQAIRERNSVH